MATVDGKQLLKQDFSEWKQSTWHQATEDEARNKIWNSPPGAGARAVHCFRGLREGRMLLGKGRTQVLIKQGKAGLTDNGVGMKIQLANPVTEAVLSYRFAFSPEYEWTLGGKLPGLSSIGFPDGGRGEKGWSNRLMWRTCSTDPDDVKTALLTSYRYYPGQPSKFGEDIFFKCLSDPGQPRVRIQSGRIHQVVLYIKLNDPGKANGIQKVWLDGKQVIDESDLIYRTSDDKDELIGGLHWHIYHGGKPTPEWTPSKNQNIWFDEVEIREGQYVHAQGDE